MANEFNTESILTMDYHVLRDYTEKAVLKKPFLITLMRETGLKNLYSSRTADPVKLAKLRCVCAYIGVSDPCKKENQEEKI